METTILTSALLTLFVSYIFNLIVWSWYGYQKKRQRSTSTTGALILAIITLVFYNFYQHNTGELLGCLGGVLIYFIFRNHNLKKYQKES